ncbi:MAG: PA0069 family radical SAM protein [Alphaproteobacteria bacterium]|nr:PA0069 family radical SAM protein [Alphaproteobacteria bacterium]
MAQLVAPNFDRLNKLSQSADADLVERPLVPQKRNRGRGAQTNVSGRFERQKRETFDDGWDIEEEDALQPFETHERLEKAVSVIARNDSPDIGFDRSINPYRGCEHGCSYCYARQTHAYLGLSAGLDFEREIFIKTNAADLLRKELSAPRYKVKPIAIGTNTDPYQPVERQHKIMRQILEVLLETKHPVTITTKSALIVRDLDILTEMAGHGLVSATIAVTSLDHKLSRLMEPRAATPARRLEAMRLLAAAGVPVSVNFAPAIPAINDHELERVLDAAKAQGATGAAMALLRLPGEVRDVFREWMFRHYPDRLRHVMSLVRDTRGGRDNDPRFGSRMRGEGPYAVMLRQRFDKAIERYGLSSRPQRLRTDLFRGPKQDDPQLTLF